MKIKILTLLLISTIALFISCNSEDCSGFEPTEITFTEIGKGSLSGNGKEGIPQSNVIISKTTEWENLISKMNTVNNVTDSFKETKINFNNYTVIAIFLEIKNSGWEIETAMVTEHQDEISIATIENNFINSVMTQPFSIIKIKKTDKKVRIK